MALLFLLTNGAGAEPELWYKSFVPYPGASKLCNKDVSSPMGHIAWTAYTTSDDPHKVKAFYRSQYAKKITAKGKDFSVEAGGHKTLSVYSRDGGYPTCHPAPGPEAKTVIIVDQFVKF